MSGPTHPCFVWIREGYPKLGEWYDDGNTFEPAAHNWKTTGNPVNVYVPDFAALVTRVQDVEYRTDATVWFDERRVMADRLAEVERERDWLRSLVDRLSASPRTGHEGATK